MRHLYNQAVTGVFLAFAGTGVNLASWESRLPQIREQLRTSPGTLGLVILFAAIGSMAGTLMGGTLTARLGAARSIRVMMALSCAGVVLIGLGAASSLPVAAAGCLISGLGGGAASVSANIAGAAVEQAAKYPLMPRFHAGFSVGAVAGAGVGAVMALLHVAVWIHLVVVEMAIIALVPAYAARAMRSLPASSTATVNPPRAAAAWREPRTLLIGLFVLCMTISEGTGNDWLSLALVQGHGANPALGAAGLTVFLASMTAGRWWGGHVLARFGRRRTLRCAAVLGAAGVGLVVLAPGLIVAVVAAGLWGIGTSLGFPTGVSAAAGDAAHASSRVGVVSSVAYTAFLGGPPVIGTVANIVGVDHAIALAVGILLCAAALANVLE